MRFQCYFTIKIGPHIKVEMNELCINVIRMNKYNVMRMFIKDIS